MYQHLFINARYCTHHVQLFILCADCSMCMGRQSSSVVSSACRLRGIRPARRLCHSSCLNHDCAQRYSSSSRRRTRCTQPQQVNQRNYQPTDTAIGAGGRVLRWDVPLVPRIAWWKWRPDWRDRTLGRSRHPRITGFTPHETFERRDPEGLREQLVWSSCHTLAQHKHGDLLHRLVHKLAYSLLG